MTKVSKRVWLITTGIVLIFCAFLVMSGKIVLAAENGCKEVNVLTGLCDETDIKGEGITKILNTVLDILTVGVGAAAVIGLVIAGIIYGTAGGNEAKTTQAKQLIFNVVLGLLLYAVMYSALNFFLPGNVAQGG